MKAIGAENITIRPFVVHKSQIVTHISGSLTAGPSFNVGTAITFNSSSAAAWQTAVNSWSSASAPTNSDGSFTMPLFQSVQAVFYASASDAKGLPPKSASFVTGSGSALFRFPNGDGYFQYPLSHSCYVVNIGQQLFGEKIKPGTFNLSAPSLTASVVDDSLGRLYVSSSTTSASLVGNLFYGSGIGIIARDLTLTDSEIIGTGGMFFDSGSTLVAKFSSSVTFYEYQVFATINADEFNFSSNPSATGEGTFSGRGRATLTGGGAISGSGVKISDLMLSGSLSPYMTSIGLYNKDNQLVAVAKLPRAIQRSAKTQQSIVVRFDV